MTVEVACGAKTERVTTGTRLGRPRKDISVGTPTVNEPAFVVQLARDVAAASHDEAASDRQATVRIGPTYQEVKERPNAAVRRKVRL